MEGKVKPMISPAISIETDILYCTSKYGILQCTSKYRISLYAETESV